MGILLQFTTCVLCIEVALSQPLRDDRSQLYGEYRPGLLKKDSYYPVKESLLTSMGFYEHSRGGVESHRKKAVDSTFIRFGRSSTPSVPHRTPEDDPEEDEAPSQRFIVNQNGCRITSSQELFQALMNDPNCARAFPKVKREHVHDTFIRFGKRSVPSFPRKSRHTTGSSSISNSEDD